MYITQVLGGEHLHVASAHVKVWPLFHISETDLPYKGKTHYVQFWSILRFFLYHSIRLEKAHPLVKKICKNLEQILRKFGKKNFKTIMFFA